MTRTAPGRFPLTLASDFGSPYPAAMKGVVRRRSDAEILDVDHDLPRGDPLAAAFWLRFVLPEFPPAVHCAVVDPGVGTDRAALAVRAGTHVIVAPDNGLALPPARALAAVGRDGNGGEGDDGDVDVYRIDGFDPASSTFHGRDVFAPAAADLREAVVDELAGSDASTITARTVRRVLDDADWLNRTDEYVDVEIPEPTVRKGEEGDGAATDTDLGVEPVAIEGEVVVVDDFGNAITNVPGEYVRGRDRASVNGDPVPIGETFADVPVGDRLVTVGSHGYVECDVNDGCGSEAFGLSPGDAVAFEFE
ncbi:SAM-dependent chlorinase/fluorinase [Halorubrum sp. F4]|uniref:SAM hydrolase/SAM-dependent halogenase family protein n=1 Tax=Halorubrum sp. F4 TaxID=2989715 RepID=UPI002480ECF4|nr:SAM-dependent chlorinase/fluorinase [Halorubrum sp. F4]